VAHWDATSRLDNPYVDWNLRHLAARLPPDPGIFMIDIDEPTLEAMTPEYGRYPWSRIEGTTRGRARVPVSAAARAACSSRYPFVDHGLVQLKGKEEMVHLYEPKWESP